MNIHEPLKTIVNTRVLCYNAGIVKEEGSPLFRLYRPITNNLIMKPSFYTRKDVLSLTTLSRSTIDRLEAKGKFPKRIRLTPNRVVWLPIHIDKWIKELNNAN